MLLPGELELAAEDVGRTLERRVDVAALHRRATALEAVGRDGLADGDDGGQRLVVDLDGERAEAGRLERLAEHPADRLAVEHDLAREERLVVLDAGVVDAGHVVGGEHPHDAGHPEGRCGAQGRDPGVCVRRLHRVGVEHGTGPPDEVVGVERGPGDVQRRGLVRELLPHHGIRRSLRQGGHAPTPTVALRAYSLGRAVPSMADR